MGGALTRRSASGADHPSATATVDGAVRCLNLDHIALDACRATEVEVEDLSTAGCGRIYRRLLSVLAFTRISRVKVLVVEVDGLATDETTVRRVQHGNGNGDGIMLVWLARAWREL